MRPDLLLATGPLDGRALIVCLSFSSCWGATNAQIVFLEIVLHPPTPPPDD